MKKFILLLLVLWILPGCFLVATATNAFQESGLTASSRRSLLLTALDEAKRLRLQGRISEQKAYIDPEGGNEAYAALRARGKKEKIVEFTIVELDSSDDWQTATLTVELRSFEAPFYTVEDRSEEQKWRYYTTAGWKLYSLKSLP